MKYIKIINETTTVITRTKQHTFVKDELYTVTEANKLKDQFGLPQYIVVDIPKNKTGFFFGAKIELKEVK